MSDTEPQMQHDDDAGPTGPTARDADAGRIRGGDAEEPATGDQDEEGEDPARAPAPPYLGVGALVLASILIPISVISVWAIRTVTNTDQYVETMAPLARNPVIVDHLATRATDALFSTHIVQNKVTQALPKKAKPLVAPIMNEVHDLRRGLGAQGLLEPEVRQAVGHAEPPQPRRP